MHFRIQSGILVYIDEGFENGSDGDDQMREELVRLFKSQLSDPEMHLLLYYGLSHFADAANLKHLLIKYRVLDALLQKGPEYIWHRIPEISYYEQQPTSDG